MDAYDLPAAVVSCLIASVYFGWGYARIQKELRGEGAGGEMVFLLAIILPGAALYFFGLEHPFWGDVVMNLTGMLLGFSAAYYGYALIHRLRRRTR